MTAKPPERIYLVMRATVRVSEKLYTRKSEAQADCKAWGGKLATVEPFDLIPVKAQKRKAKA